MNLAQFDQPEPIFLDANIFVYHFHHDSPYHPTCTAFLRRVALGELSGVISTLVIDEVVYALLIHTGSHVLQTTKVSLIKQRLTHEPALARQCYAKARVAWDLLAKLRQGGMRVLEVPFDLMEDALRLGAAHGLLPRDAMHYAVCLRHRIHHVASRDAHFQRLPHLQFWSP